MLADNERTPYFSRLKLATQSDDNYIDSNFSLETIALPKYELEEDEDDDDWDDSEDVLYEAEGEAVDDDDLLYEMFEDDYSDVEFCDGLINVPKIVERIESELLDLPSGLISTFCVNFGVDYDLKDYVIVRISVDTFYFVPLSSNLVKQIKGTSELDSYILIANYLEGKFQKLEHRYTLGELINILTKETLIVIKDSMDNDDLDIVIETTINCLKVYLKDLLN